MPVIDVHAHLTPERFKEAIRTTGEWYGLGPEAGELQRGDFNGPLSQRLQHMDAVGIDMQLLSPTVGFYQYENELQTTKVIARECNNAVAETVEHHPDRFAGLATVPMQDISAAIAEMERAMLELGMKGVIVRDHVSGSTFDEPHFTPFFQAAEELGAVIFFHQGGGTLINDRIRRYGLSNAIGNLTERTITFATLVFGGVMDKFPNLKPLLAHGGGYTAFGIGRLDKMAGAKESTDPSQGLTPPFGHRAGEYVLTRPPSSYLGKFSYDCCVYDGPSLRFLIDSVGSQQVMLGTDYPAPMLLLDSVNWVMGLEELTVEEKTAILSGNAMKLLGIEDLPSRTEPNRTA